MDFPDFPLDPVRRFVQEGYQLLSSPSFDWPVVPPLFHFGYLLGDNGGYREWYNCRRERVQPCRVG
jgi:hypothetical protein